MKLLLILFISLNLGSALGNSTFLENCNESGKSKLSQDMEEQIIWLKVLFKSKSCIEIKNRIEKLKSFNEIIPIQFLKGKRRQHAFKPIELIPTQISFFAFEKDWTKAENHFSNIELFREFKNLKHILYENYGHNGRNLCQTVAQAPMINSVTVNKYKLTNEEIGCIVSDP